MPQQSSLYHSSEALVLIPVWETERKEIDRDAGKHFSFLILVVILHQDGEDRHDAA